MTTVEILDVFVNSFPTTQESICIKLMWYKNYNTFLASQLEFRENFMSAYPSIIQFISTSMHRYRNILLEN